MPLKYDRLDRYSPKILSIFRIVSALLLLQHGSAKLLGYPRMPMFAGHLPPLIVTAGILELVGGVLLALGLFTRPVAFLLSGEMAVAYFLYHAPQGFFPIVNMGDVAVLFCFTFFYIFFAGPGAWSIDGRISRKI